MGTFVAPLELEGHTDFRQVSISPDGGYVAASTTGATWVRERVERAAAGRRRTEPPDLRPGVRP